MRAVRIQVSVRVQGGVTVRRYQALGMGGQYVHVLNIGERDYDFTSDIRGPEGDKGRTGEEEGAGAQPPTSGLSPDAGSIIA